MKDFDTVIGSDILYDSGLFPSLLSTLDHVLMPGGHFFAVGPREVGMQRRAGLCRFDCQRTTLPGKFIWRPWKKPRNLLTNTFQTWRSSCRSRDAMALQLHLGAVPKWKFCLYGG